MSKKLYNQILDRLLCEDVETARSEMKNYITRKAASIDRKLKENGNEPVYVADIEDESVHITKCESVEVAELFVEMLEKEKDEDEETSFEIHNTLPKQILDAAEAANALTEEDLDQSSDPIADSEHSTVEVSKEEWDESIVTEDVEDEQEDDTLIVTTYDDYAAKKISRILRTHAESFNERDEEDLIVFTASFDDAELLERVAERIDEINEVEEIYITNGSELTDEVDDEEPDVDSSELSAELNALGAKFIAINGASVDDIDDIDPGIKELDEALELAKVQDPKLDGSKGIGADKSKINVNNKSPLIQNNKSEAEPVEIISQNHNGYDREKSPAVNTRTIAKNQRSKAFVDFKNVSRDGDSRAELNSKKGFGSENNTSPVVASKPYKKRK